MLIILILDSLISIQSALLKLWLHLHDLSILIDFRELGSIDKVRAIMLLSLTLSRVFDLLVQILGPTLIVAVRVRV